MDTRYTIYFFSFSSLPCSTVYQRSDFELWFLTSFSRFIIIPFTLISFLQWFLILFDSIFNYISFRLFDTIFSFLQKFLYLVTISISFESTTRVRETFERGALDASRKRNFAKVWGGNSRWATFSNLPRAIWRSRRTLLRVGVPSPMAFHGKSWCRAIRIKSRVALEKCKTGNRPRERVQANLAGSLEHFSFHSGREKRIYIRRLCRFHCVSLLY